MSHCFMITCHWAVYRRVLPALIAAFFFGLVASGWAVETRTLSDNTFADFNKGVSTGTELMQDGRVKPGPRAVLVEKSSEGLVWQIATDENSGAVYYSTGHSGKVFRIGPDGRQELWCDLTELQATALAVSPDGQLYVGASPGGKIYVVADQGNARPSWETGEEYIWDMLFDADGALFVATGTSGKIYRIADRDSKAEVYYDSEATNVMDLEFDLEGRLLAATQGKAYVIQISEANKGYILYAASQDELRALSVDGAGNIYAAANSARISQVFDKSTTGSESSNLSKLGGTGVVVQIHPNGFVNALANAPEGPIHDLLADTETTSILAAAGKNGKLYRINTSDGNYSVVADIDEPIITALAHSSTGTLIGSANKAVIYRLEEADPEFMGQFASRALDADSTVRWGNLMYDGEIPEGTALHWETRSGNTPEPSDGSWSEWTSSTLIGSQIARVESPIAQYLQYRVTFNGTPVEAGQPEPFIDSVEVFYVEQNVPPVIKSISVEKVTSGRSAAQTAALASAVANIASGSSSDSSDNDSDSSSAQSSAARATAAAAQAAQAAARARAQRGNQNLQNSQRLTISWNATDANEDKLRFNLYYKGEDESVWKMVEENLTESKHQFSTEAIPDGKYRFRLEATDRFENPQTSASTVEATSRIYIVDNTAPEIREFSSVKTGENEYEIRVEASDETSIIAAAEYNLNAGDEWLRLAPTDGIYDFHTEKFVFRVSPEEDQAEHTLSVRVFDGEGNSRVEKILLK